MTAIEIFFDDLSIEKQNELLEAYNITDPEEMNWETVPIATINVDDTQQEE